MYKNHFSLNRLPFSAIPDVSGYYPAESIEAARCTILQVLENGTGIPLVFGETGMGKSLLLRVLEKSFENDCHVVYMANQRLRRPKSLYQHLLFSLHQSYCGMDENELRLMFLDHLRQTEMRCVILLIDEAQTLGRSTLEELRVLLHNNHGDNYVTVRLALAGDHRFEERLTHPHLAAFQQQVVARCYLEKFLWEETDAEILWQLKQAGCETPGSLFLPEARKAVHQLTEGIPRIVHQLCQQALTFAAESELFCVDETAVRTAWRLLQQLPISENRISRADSNDPSSEVPKDGVSIIEFGTLDDDDPIMPSFDTDSMSDELAEFPVELPPEPEPPEPLETKPAEYAMGFVNTFKIPLQKFGPSFLGDTFSDKTVFKKKQPVAHRGESCQKLLDELSVMEQLLTEEISVINKMKKIESDCLSRRVRRVSPTDILAGFPELPKKK
ncbi:MAG: AAA family ATPase [Planctomycetaceae bacterium]|nr:AAA family ATPase [Planctomycetaceae bacterium]